ncbi:MAG: hypothetical protein AAF417_21760, partial [Pseudomonadota bacterium]
MIRLFRHYIPKTLVVLGLADFSILFLAVFVGVSPPFIEPSPTGKLLVGALWPKALFYTVTMMSTMAIVGLYQRDIRDDLRGVSLRLSVAVTLGLVVLVMVLYLYPKLTIGGTALSLSLLVSVIGIGAVRTLVFRFSEREEFKRKVLILGAGERAQEAEALVLKGEDTEVAVLGYVHVRGETAAVDRADRIYLETNLLDLCSTLQVEELVVAIDEDAVEFPVSQILDC